MSEAPRISPQKARERTESGAAILVCAYDDPEKCEKVALEGSIPLRELESRLGSIEKDRAIVFYCA